MLLPKNDLIDFYFFNLFCVSYQKLNIYIFLFFDFLIFHHLNDINATKITIYFNKSIIVLRSKFNNQ